MCMRLLVLLFVMSAMGEVMQVKKLVDFATLPVRGSAFAAGRSLEVHLEQPLCNSKRRARVF